MNGCRLPSPPNKRDGVLFYAQEVAFVLYLQINGISNNRLTEQRKRLLIRCFALFLFLRPEDV